MHGRSVLLLLPGTQTNDHEKFEGAREQSQLLRERKHYGLQENDKIMQIRYRSKVNFLARSIG